MTERDIPALRLRASELSADITRKEEELAQLAEVLALPASAAKIRQLHQRRLRWLQPEAKRVIWTWFALLSEEEQDAILVAMPHNELRLTNQELTVKRECDSLRDELAPVQAELDKIAYPVLSIPTEVTSEIFSHVGSECRVDGSCIDPSTAPLLLLRVCQAWKSIATSTPVLWRFFKLTITENSSFPIDQLPPLLETWLVRARSCSMLVELSGPAACELPPGTLHAILRHAWHIQELKLTGFSVPNLHIGTRSASFPRLTMLELTPASFGAHEEDYIDLFNDAPQLSWLTMSAAITPSPRFVPWSRLSRFTGSDLTNQGAVDVMRFMPDIIGCTLEMADDAEDADAIPPSSPPVSFTRLRDLSLRQTDDRSVSLDVLGIIAAPTLSALEIWGVEASQNLALEAFLQRPSSSSLRDLLISIVGGAFGRIGMLSGLRITFLNMNGMPHACAMELFERLAAPVFLPTLMTLMTSSTHPSGRGDAGEFALHAGEAMLARVAAGTEEEPCMLKTLHMSCYTRHSGIPEGEPFAEEVLAPFWKLEQAGVNVGLSLDKCYKMLE